MIRYGFVLAILVMGSTPVVHAGQYSDDLAKCLVESTSAEDRTRLVRWMFAASSRHPAVQSLASISDEQMDEANKQVADLFTSLVTNSCRSEAREALTYEGETVITSSFKILARVGGQELFSSQEVADSLSSLQGHLDGGQLRSILDMDDDNDE